MTNLVTFTFRDTTLFLTLEGEWSITPGISPSVNSAIVPYTEFAKLGGKVQDLVGSIRFWSNVDPRDNPAGTPADVELKRIRLVDVIASKWGQIAPDTPAIVTEYRLTFADAREGFVRPRGGFLADGEINKEPLADPKEIRDDPSDGGTLQDFTSPTDANGNSVRTFAELVARCLGAMGIDARIIPASIGAIPPLMNVEWRGNHAATELENLLKMAGHFLFVRADGTFGIAQAGDGEGPEIPAAQALPPLPYPSIDRRGNTVIFCSAPNGVQETKTINLGPAGPSDLGMSGFPDPNAKNRLQFMVRETTGAWVTIEEASYFQTKEVGTFNLKISPINVLKTEFKTIDSKFREWVKADLFHCFRLNPDVFGPEPLLRVIRGDGKAARAIEVEGRIAVQGADMMWDATATSRIDVAELIDGDIVRTVQRLTRVPKPTLNPVQDAEVLLDNELSIRTTREGSYRHGQEWAPEYYYVGFVQELGGISQLSVTEMSNILGGDPDATVVCRPELILRRVDGDDVNEKNLVNQARRLAPAYLRSGGDPAKIVLAKGFVPGDIDGTTASIKYDQANLQTHFTVNTFYLPSGEYSDVANGGSSGGSSGGGQKFPMQNQTAGVRLALGAGGATQPSVPIMAATVPTAAADSVLVKLLGNLTGKGKYYGILVNGQSTADTDSDEKMPEGLTDATAANLMIVNLGEDDGQVELQSTGHRLPPGYYIGRLVGGGPGGPIVVIESLRCGAKGDGVTLGSSDCQNEAADSASVEAVDTRIVNLTIQTRTVYNPTGDATFYAMFRVFRLACGRITDISGEFRRTIVSTEPCDGSGGG